MLTKTKAALAVLLIGIGVMAPVNPANAAGCWGQSCYGKDPEAMGCGGSTVRNLDQFEYEGRSVTVELRYSPNCYAVWTRYRNFWGHDGAVYTKSMSTEGMATRKEFAQYREETGWTAMVSFTEKVRGCYTFFIQYHGWETKCTGEF